ncbi:hypothetical protein BXZ70DRAFT_912324 [Cristinia sonorae]|uniref:Uncharacterized protein n=1 Tax=Cristinia sonorae TaxID=1940300 RepID=A0A8K0UXZ7_9AGAR|nr:hypothetical protein BXZ70DRAFT_912324 [Cristinia sonorae]
MSLPPGHQACLDALARASTHLDKGALGSKEVQQFIPEHELKSLATRHQELRAQHAILDWTTAFPTIYHKKSVKSYIAKSTLPHKCRSLEKAAAKWKKDAEHAAALADQECQRERRERLDRYRKERTTPVFGKQLAQGGQSPTTSEFSIPRWEARSMTSVSESMNSLPLEDGHMRPVAPWLMDETDNRSSIPSTILSSAQSASSLHKPTAPWLARSPSGNSFRDIAGASDTFLIKTTLQRR